MLTGHPFAPAVAAKDLPKETLLKFHANMVEQRRFEEAAGRAYGTGKIFGFCHLYIGQEAISVGSAAALKRGDVYISAYRIHAQAIAMGIPAQAVMDELFGRATGCVGGLGGSMHLFDVDKGFWGGWGLVGQQVPMAVGVAFSQKYRKTDNVTLVFFGDGALQQGAIHEALNMASIWDSPILFVLENNKYGMGTAVNRVSSISPAHEMAASYKMEHGVFDGMDVLASYDAFAGAVEKNPPDKPANFPEANCSRFRGHSMSDPGKYRSKEELEAEKAADPIPRLERFLIERGYATADQLLAVDEATKEQMKEVLARAEAAPWPSPEMIDKFVYAEPIGKSPMEIAATWTQTRRTNDGAP